MNRFVLFAVMSVAKADNALRALARTRMRHDVDITRHDTGITAIDDLKRTHQSSAAHVVTSRTSERRASARIRADSNG